MSAQTDKASMVVARFSPTGRVTSSRFFRPDEHAEGIRYATQLTEQGIPCAVTHLKGKP